MLSEKEEREIVFGLRKQVNKLEQAIERISVQSHTHPEFPMEDEMLYFRSQTFNDTVKKLWNERKVDKKAIANLQREIDTLKAAYQSDLAAIHAAYRSQYCGDCCHDAVCEKKAGIKYGDKCETKEVNCPRKMML